MKLYKVRICIFVDGNWCYECCSYTQLEFHLKEPSKSLRWHQVEADIFQERLGTLTVPLDIYMRFSFTSLSIYSYQPLFFLTTYYYVLCLHLEYDHKLPTDLSFVFKESFSFSSSLFVSSGAVFNKRHFYISQGFPLHFQPNHYHHRKNYRLICVKHFIHSTEKFMMQLLSRNL